jgi:hypothetical protein
MLRSFIVIDPHLVNLIRENPRYTKMTLEEILGKFVSGCMMEKEARYVDDIANGPLPLYEPQPVALKATSNKEALSHPVLEGTSNANYICVRIRNSRTHRLLKVNSGKVLLLHQDVQDIHRVFNIT